MPFEKVNVSNLSPWQEFLSQKFPGKGAKITPEAFEAAALEHFGPIPIPPGSQIIRQSAGEAEYIDAQGFRHVLRRSLDGRDPNAGQVSDNTDRPAVLPQTGGGQEVLSSLTGGANPLIQQQLSNATATARGQAPTDFYQSQINDLARQLQASPGLLQLDPETAAALQAITARDQGFLKQQFDQQQGTTLAQLFGNRVNQSSIATSALARLLQEQGLVTAQSQADAALRELQTRQFLTGQQQGNRELALRGLQTSAGLSQGQSDSLLALLNQLSGQQTQRDITNANIGLGEKELAERGRQANLAFQLNQQNADLALANARASSGPLTAGLGLAGALLTAPIGGVGGASLLSTGLGSLGSALGIGGSAARRALPSGYYGGGSFG